MVIERDEVYAGKQQDQDKNFSHKRIQMLVKKGREMGLPHDNTVIPKEYIGLTDCGCNAGWEGGWVLDLFCGSGTVGVEAKKQGKNFIGIEANLEYVKMAEERIGE
jgi:DNA modification methylase